MAVQEQTPYIEYVGNGATKSFATTFSCESKEQLSVLIDDQIASNWTYENGVVVFTAAPTLNSIIKLKRKTKLERTTNYQSFNNSLNPKTLNTDFDRVWYAMQDLNYKVNQYDLDYDFILKQVRPITTGGTGANNPSDARENLNTYSKEEVDALIATGGEGNIVPIAGGGTGASTAEQARDNLGVPSTIEVASAIDEATPNATEAVAGKAKIATTVIAQEGVDDTNIMTPKKVKDQVSVGGRVHANGYFQTVSGVTTILKSKNILSVVQESTGLHKITTVTNMDDINFTVQATGALQPGYATSQGSIIAELLNSSNQPIRTLNSFKTVSLNGSALLDSYRWGVTVIC